jgi:hypothetical protein
MENFDNFIGSIAVSVLQAGLEKGTEIGFIVGTIAVRVCELANTCRPLTILEMLLLECSKFVSPVSNSYGSC